MTASITAHSSLEHGAWAIYNREPTWAVPTNDRFVRGDGNGDAVVATVAQALTSPEGPAGEDACLILVVGIMSI